jgi:nucleoside-diphosphate-sugar epimerase/predicted dehydrogenase
MKIGIIGSGQIAQIHGPLIIKQPAAQIVGIADKDLTRARSLASKLKTVHVYQDAEMMIKEQKPDIVHVLTPPQYHASLSIMAMNHGCHVLVEKPMALNMADAEKMINVAKQNGVRLCVNHNIIYDKTVQKAIKLVSLGAIGELVTVEAYFLYDARRNPAILEDGSEFWHWLYRLNGGPLEDLMPHMAALLFEFLPVVEEIQSIGLNRGKLPKSWQDEIRVLVKSSGLVGHIHISLNEKPDAITLTFKGTQGGMQANLFNGILTLQKISGLPRAVNRGLSGFQLGLQNLKGAITNIYKFATGHIDKSGGIEQIISRFYASILNGHETPISLDKSLRVVDLITRVWPAPTVVPDEIQPNLHLIKRKDKRPTALVTGASGFIGTYLVKKLLSEGITVRALLRPNSIHAGRLKTLDVDVMEGSLDDAEVIYEATKDIKTVYHAGATMSNDWQEHYQVNIKGTEYLIKAALAHGIERLVHLSTLAVYDVANSKKNSAIKEDSPYQKDPKGMGPYAYSKIEAERLVLDAYRKQGLKATIVRPGIVIGPMGRIFFPHLGYRYQDRLFLVVGKGNIPLPLTCVENTVDGIYKASIEEKAIGQVYNLIDDGEITVRDYLERFIKITGIQARIITVPYGIPYLATTAYEIAAYFNLLSKGITSRAQLKGKQVKVYFDSTKAKHELGWIPRVTIDDCLNQTFGWYAAKYR